MTTLAAVGAALPSRRLTRSEVGAAWSNGGGRGETSVCADDEDVLTLSVAAGLRALAAAQVRADDIDALVWGTTRPPYAEGPSHAVLAAALGLRADVGGALVSGSTHSGMEALGVGSDMVAAGTSAKVLVITADDRQPGLGTSFEPLCASAAVAVVLTAGEGPATLGARVTRSAPVADRYRGAQEAATRETYDGRLYREETFLPLVSEVAAALADGTTAWSIPDPDGRLGAVIAKKVKAEKPSLTATIGDTGAAAALLGALPALATPGTVTVLGHGSGRTTGVQVSVTEPVPGAAPIAALLEGARPISYAAVLRARAQLVPSGESIPMAIPPGSAMNVRGGHETLTFEGARCADCGTINVPPSVHPVCQSCASDKLDVIGLARQGTVHTCVTNVAMPPPFVAPLPIAVIDLDDGARVMLQVTGNPVVAIGDRVEVVFRRYAVERGAPVYGYKALVAPGQES